MPKIPIVSGIKVVKALAKIGYETDHQTGSHIILRHKQSLSEINSTFYKERMSIQSMQRQDKDQEVSQEIEKMMEDIDTGKVKTTRFTATEFLKFVDKTVSG